MKRAFILFVAAAGMAALAQEPPAPPPTPAPPEGPATPSRVMGSPERITATFSDPSRPKTVKISLINGGITVKGYSGKEVIIEGRGELVRNRREAPPGMHRIDVGGPGLQVEESENTMTIGTGRPGNAGQINLQVPFDTSLKLRTVNGGNIVVDGVTGDLDIDNTNGGVTLTHISGTVVAHALNGKMLVSMDKLTPNKPMSFSSFNGDVDVTLPADARANVKMKTDNGEIFSDFDVKLDLSSHAPTVEDNRSNRGRYRVRFDHGVSGTVNGGGPELQFTTFNGNIYIRKGK